MILTIKAKETKLIVFTESKTSNEATSCRLLRLSLTTGRCLENNKVNPDFITQL